MSIYNFNYTSIEGKDVSLKDYEGKVLLIVNTASKCGFTPQYEGLEELYKKYKDQGFEIIGFPSNQFLEQEPGSSDEIKEFCKLRYGVTFPLSEKVEVREEGTIPLYKYLVEAKPFKGMGAEAEGGEFVTILKDIYKDTYDDPQIKWNFTKFLIGKDGEVIERFEPVVEPKDIAGDIEKALAK